MRIALVAPLISTIAQPYIGGAQVILADLAYGLQRRGHEVTLFARAGSYLEGISIEPIVVPDSVQPATFVQSESSSTVAEGFFAQAHLFLSLFLRLQQQSQAFDLIHVHAFDWPAYTLSALVRDIPVLHTLHLPALAPEINQALRTLDQQGHPLTLIAVSQSCAQTYARFTSIDAVVHNGLNVADIPFQDKLSRNAPLLYAGRISPEKGVEAAISIAQKARLPLLIMGEIYDQRYFDLRIAPLLTQAGPGIRYLGQMRREKVWEVMSHAACLLCPINWEEAFGLTTIEAMATGTPVIAYRRGAMAEIIQHGQTGFLVEPGDEVQAVEAISRLAELSRARCRTYVEQTFPLEKMLARYEQFYQASIARTSVLREL